MRKLAKISGDKIIEALHEIGPYPVKVAERLGVSYRAIWKRIAEHPELKAAWDAEIERQFDIAESAIMAGINSGDARLAMEFMKSKGKSRGYSTRVEQVGLNGGPIRQAVGPDFEGMTDAQLDAYYKRLLKGADGGEDKTGQSSEG